MHSAMRRTRPFSLIVNASRASRHGSSASAAARGVSASGRPVRVQRRRGRGEHVAVHGLDRGDAFEQEVDASAARFALVPLVEAAAHALRVAVRVAVALHLGVELGAALRRVGRRPRRPRPTPPHRAARRRRARSRPYRRAGWARPANSARRLASGPASARARASWPPGERGRERRGRRQTPSVSSAARSSVVGNGIEVDALAARPDRRQQVVGARRHEHDDGARRRLLQASSAARSRRRPVARTTSRPRTAAAPCAHPRPGCGALRGSPCRGCRRPCTTRRRARTRRRRDACRAAASRTRAASSPAPIEQRREVDAPRLRPRTRAARRADTRATGARVARRARRALAPARSTSGRHRAQTTMPGQRDGLDRRPDPVGDLVAGAAARRRAASPVPRASVAVRGADRRVEVGARPAPCGRGSAATRPLATSSGRSSTTTRSGSRSPAANALRRSTGSTPSAAADALVRERRRREAVADDHRSRGERGPDHLGDVLRTVGEHQQQLGRARRAPSPRAAAAAGSPRRRACARARA